MATLMGTTSTLYSGVSASLTSTSLPSSPLSSSSQKVFQRSSLWGNRLPALAVIQTIFDDSARHCSMISSSLTEQETPKRCTAVRSMATDMCAHLSADDDDMASFGVQTSEAQYSPFSKAVADAKVWKASKSSKKTTRRRALAICLALATVSQRGNVNSQELQNSASVAHARELISLSSSSSPAPSSSRWEGFGDLVTVSTGSSNSSNNGVVKGLPSWMAGNFNLCMGDGFHVQLPADWHMHDIEGQHFDTVLRYEDKVDPSTNVVVLKCPTSQSRTDDLGNPEDWIREQANILTASNEPVQIQLRTDETMDTIQHIPSGSVSVAKVDKPKSKQGLTYYNYEIVTNQGGREDESLHELLSAVINNGNLYMCRVQTGEGRWEQSTQSIAQRIVDSFQITGYKIQV